MSFPEEFVEDFALFFEFGCVAIRQGDELGAKRVFDALRVLNENHTGADAGHGLIALYKMELEVARDYFNKVIETDSENWSVLGFLAITHMLLAQTSNKVEVQEEGLQKSYDYATQVIKESKVESSKNLAESVLAWHRFLNTKRQDAFL